MINLTKAERADIFLKLLQAMQVPASPRKRRDMQRYTFAEELAFFNEDIPEIRFWAGQLKNASERTGNGEAAVVSFAALTTAMGGRPDTARLACEKAGYFPGDDGVWVDHANGARVIEVDVASIEAAR